MKKIILKSSTTVKEVTDFFAENFPDESPIGIATLKGNQAGPDRKLRALTEQDLSCGIEIELKDGVENTIIEIESKTGLTILNGENVSDDNDTIPMSDEMKNLLLQMMGISTSDGINLEEDESNISSFETIGTVIIKPSTTVQFISDLFSEHFPDQPTVGILTIKGSKAGSDRKLRALTEKDLSGGIEIEIKSNIDETLENFSKITGLATWRENLDTTNEFLDNNDIEEDDDDEKGYPALIRRALKNEDGTKNDEANDAAQEYLLRWQCPTETYNMRLGVSAKIPDFVSDLDQSCSQFTKEQIAFISDQITNEKIIPALGYLPSELFEFTKSIWWLVPLSIWKEDTASWIFIDKNGFYAPYSDDNGGDLIFTWEKIGSLDFDWTEENLCQLTLYAADSEGVLTFDEFVPEGRGSYLSIIKDIYDIYEPVIEASKGQRTWKHGAGKEGYLTFESSKELLDKKSWKVDHRPDPSDYL